MRGHRGRRHRHEEPEEHNDERWMASYMDMVTVLMCMFIVLFAMSTVDANKFEQLRNSLATGFGQKEVGRIDTATGTVVPPDKVRADAEGFSDLELAKRELADLEELQKKIEAGLTQKGLQGTVDYQIDQRGLTIRLVNAQTFFEPNRVELVGVAPQVIDTISAALAPSSYSVSVEGHADIRQPQAPYPTNWELSSGRAVQVLRRMIDVGGVAPAAISAVGYGDSRPLDDGSTPEALSRNRRVDVVALSQAPESVRALIPGLLALPPEQRAPTAPEDTADQNAGKPPKVVTSSTSH